jgi:hypothetical protein
VWPGKINKSDSHQDNFSGEFLLREVWRRCRPYLIALLVDFFISACLWLALFAFHRLTKALAINGWEGNLIVAVHSMAIVLAFITFGVLFALDVISIRRKHV